MLMGSSLESNWNAGAVGDNGHSFGPFQIYLVAHPNVTAAQAADPTWAAKFMLPAYQAGVAKVQPGLWSSDPALAAAQAAFNAEHPAKMYSGYEQKWSQVQAALNGADISGPVTGAATTGGGGGGLLSDPFGINSAVTGVETSFTHGLMTLANMIVFFMAASSGAILFLTGVALIFWGTPMGQRAGQVATTALSFAGPQGRAASVVLSARGAANKSKAIQKQQAVAKQSTEKAAAKSSAPKTPVKTPEVATSKTSGVTVTEGA
jgi:hypothetical protein